MRQIVSLGVLAVLVAAPAWSQAALPLTSTSTNRVNATDIDPDERFFTVKGVPSNIFFLVDTSGSMRELVVQAATLYRPTEGTCTDTLYNDVVPDGFDPAGNHPPPDMGVDPASDEGVPGLFTQDKYYVRTSSVGANDAINGLKLNHVHEDWTYASASSACRVVKSSQRSKCEACMNTAGYFLGHSSGTTKAEVFRGQFLNVYPPKYVTARAVLKKVIWDTDNVRMGLARFNGGSGASMVKSFAPSCPAIQHEDSAQWLSSKRDLIKKVGDKGGNGLTFNDSTPLAEALFDVAQYFTTNSAYSNWFGSAGRDNNFKSPGITHDDRSVCYGCQVNAVVVISDGLPNADDNSSFPSQIRNLNIGLSSSYLDDVAHFFFNNDLQPDSPTSGWSADGDQILRTYTIGFGIDAPILESAAEHGGGEYQSAIDAVSLTAALTEAIDSVKSRAMAYGSTSVATLQTSAQGSTVVPRFVPNKEGEPWQGYLYRFKLENEAINGCAPVASGTHPKDLDKDGKCTSLAYVDADGDVIQEAPTSGDFVKVGTLTPARPIWEAGHMLTYGSMATAAGTVRPGSSTDGRNIWTVYDSNGDGKLTDDDQMIEFTEANVDKLMGPMGLKADVRGDATCRAIYARLGIGGIPEIALQNWGQTCAKALIAHYRGRDNINPDPGLRNRAKPWLLADIFHSSPVVVEPPMLPDSCSYFPGQCIASLWNKEGSFSDADTREAYTNYVQGTACGGTDCEKRRSIVLVGSNGGFLHAFDMGGPASSTPDRDPLSGRLAYDDPGTGKELWAFVPPDILGVMKYGLDRHTFMVDGTAMVRDVWADGSGTSAKDGKKDQDEFRTMAVVGTGSGGRHFFALDVTKDAVNNKPDFRWIWPQPNDPRVADMGDSFSNFHPRPPPIGPVLVEDSNGFDYTYRAPNAAGTTFEEKGPVKAAERWIVGLNGGLDRALQRGRGFALVDVWNGETVWDFFWEPGLPVADTRRNLTHPVPAGLALLDLGAGELTADTPFDGYFDTFTVGDLGGSVWVGRMLAPGKFDATTKKVTNWHAARGFQTAKATPKNRRPISYLTANALQKNTGYLRTFFGTGDRAALLEDSPGACELGNLSGCVELGCRVELSEFHQNLPGTGRSERYTSFQSHQVGSQELLATGTCFASKCAEPKVAACAQNCTEASCTAASGNTAAAGVRACVQQALASCPGSCGPDGDRGMISLVNVHSCPSTTTAAGGRFARAVYSRCGTEVEHSYTVDPTDPDLVTDNPYDAWACRSSTYKNETGRRYLYGSTTGAAAIKHGFVGAHLFGGTASRTFASAGTATTFDTARYTEADLTNLGALSAPVPGVEASQTGKGWHLSYDGAAERTGSPAGMTASFTGESMCVVWNSLLPEGEAEVCGTDGEQTAKLIQADFITGSPLCLEQYPTGQRFTARAVLSPPPEPARATIISAAGVSSGLITTEPGHAPEFISGFTNADPLQPIYQLELTTQEHQCRHVGTAAACGI